MWCDEVLSITLDNVSTNTKVVSYVKARIYPIIDGIFHVRCACHVFNLPVKDGLDLFSCGCSKIQYFVPIFLKLTRLIEFVNLKSVVLPMNFHLGKFPKIYVLCKILHMTTTYLVKSN